MSSDDGSTAKTSTEEDALSDTEEIGIMGRSHTRIAELSRAESTRAGRLPGGRGPPPSRDEGRLRHGVGPASRPARPALVPVEDEGGGGVLTSWRMLDVLDHRTASRNDPSAKEMVRELRLAKPPANALGPELLRVLREALSRAPSEGASAVILSGSAGRFSGGMDVPALLAMDEAALTATWASFFAILRDLATYPVPVVAALTGHSPAGGTVLALFTDYRILAEGPFLVGLNEVQVGLPVPPCLFQALTYVVGARQAARLATGGLLLGPAEARAVGLVDEVVPVGEVVPRALAWADALLERPRHAMLATRSLARAPLATAAAEMTPALIGEVVRAWQSEECQRTMRALAARLAARPKDGETKA